MRSVLETLAWLLAIVYATIPSFWLMVHPFIPFWKRRPKPLRVVGVLWFFTWLIAGLLTSPWRHTLLYSHAAARLAGIFLMIAAFWIYRAAYTTLSADQLIGRSELQPQGHEQRLVTEGIRARVRHPLYLAGLCMLLGLTLAIGTVALHFLAGYALVTGVIMVRFEERELERRFGERYRDYKRRVPAILPRL